MQPDTLEITAVVGLAGVPAVVGLTELVKKSFPTLPARFYPLVALGWALALNAAVAVHRGTDPLLALVVGLIAGLTASGLYSAQRAA